ncbi:MAG TPA: DUF2085 domain-containing protein [Balneolaceae bacterium]|nr:DUF2085 domain-containing protein [Balneolaceae bacterium]
MEFRNSWLYLLVSGLLIFIIITALGGGLFGQTAPFYMQWQHKLFAGLCHQSPARSFWINGQPMAVCSRCLGIYSGFALSWFLLPALSLFSLENTSVRNVVFMMVLLNVIDVVGNVLGFWQNTLVSRLVLGWLMGWTAGLFFTGDFFKITIKSIGNHHGRITADIKQ